MLVAGRTAGGFARALVRFALPAVAVSQLDAGSIEVGTLLAASGGAAFVLGPLAGTWADRRSRRRLLIESEIAFGATTAVVALLAWANALTLAPLLLAALVLGGTVALCDVTAYALVPRLSGDAAAGRWNARLIASLGGAGVAGPAAGGLLVDGGGAGVVFLIAACAAATAVTCFRRLPYDARPSSPHTDSLWAEVRLTRSNDALRTVFSANVLTTFGWAVADAMLVVFALKTLELSVAAVGWLLVPRGVAMLVGSACGDGLSRRLGPWSALAVAITTAAAGTAVTAGAVLGAPAIAIVIGGALAGFGAGAYNVGQVTIRQLAVPDARRGRSNGVMRTSVSLPLPAGALTGGFVAYAAGEPAAIIAGAACMLLALRPLLRASTSQT